jgi:hypothetical protein
VDKHSTQQLLLVVHREELTGHWRVQALPHLQEATLQPTKAVAAAAVPTPQRKQAKQVATARSLVAEAVAAVPLTTVTTQALAATAALVLSAFGAGDDELRNS